MTQREIKCKSLYFFPNGNTACCDQYGQQIPELQLGYLEMWIKHAQSLGFNPEDLKEIHTPSGRVRLIKLYDGSFNWTSI